MRGARRLACALLLVLSSGCGAVVDFYRYQPRALPAGTEPYAAMTRAVQGLANVNWSATRERAAFERARVSVDRSGLSAWVISNPAATFPVFLSYAQIARHASVVVHSGDRWIVHVDDRLGDRIELIFRDLESTRLFLDAAVALDRQAPLASQP